MNASIEQILQQLTGKSRMEDTSLIELQKIAEAYPYFSVGHLLLSKKLQEQHELSTDAQLQRTALFFDKPLWLRHLLTVQPTEVVVPKKDEETKPLLSRVIEEEKQSWNVPAATEVKEEREVAPATIVAEADEAQYEASTTEEVLQQSADEEKQKEVIAAVLGEQLAEFRKPVAPDAPVVIETEPYHTVDYFASQGIKADLNQPQDKLGSQLRRFTDWLKQMKSVKTPENDLGTDPEVENMIQGIAKTSNETREIVTETMAQVLVKQGKTDKAIQLYIKLSFLNPDKSAYFAAKIEQLKGI